MRLWDTEIVFPLLSSCYSKQAIGTSQQIHYILLNNSQPIKKMLQSYHNLLHHESHLQIVELYFKETETTHSSPYY